jgi:plasmid stability protein
MATLTIRGLDDGVRDRLRQRAAEHGRSMEAEARAILSSAVSRSNPTTGFGSRVHARFAQLQIRELELPRRREATRAVSLKP